MIYRYAAAPVRAILIALAFTTANPAIAQQKSLGDCKCGDAREMRERWCAARAAKAEYERIEHFFRSESGKTNSTRMFSNADKEMINQKCVQEAINRATDKGADKATAETIENLPTQSLIGKDECRVVVTRGSDNACLKQIVEAHEAVHRQACLFRRDFVNRGYGKALSDLSVSSALALTFAGDTKYLLSSSDYAFEEASGYAQEMQLIADRWKILQQVCVAEAFVGELDDPGTAGQQLWDNTKPDADGKRRYKFFDLTNDPCPSRPPPPKSECTLR